MKLVNKEDCTDDDGRWGTMGTMGGVAGKPGHRATGLHIRSAEQLLLHARQRLEDCWVDEEFEQPDA